MICKDLLISLLMYLSSLSEHKLLQAQLMISSNKFSYCIPANKCKRICSAAETFKLVSKELDRKIFKRFKISSCDKLPLGGFKESSSGDKDKLLTGSKVDSFSHIFSFKADHSCWISSGLFEFFKIIDEIALLLGFLLNKSRINFKG